MKIHFILLLGLTLGCTSSNSNLDIEDSLEERYKLFISDSGNIKQKIVLSFSDSTVYEIEASFLGEIETESEKNLKILNVVHSTGLYRDAIRARAELLIFDSKNELIGKYEIGYKDNLPIAIQEKKKLIFIPRGDCNSKTVIDFSTGPPKDIFIECKDNNGNLYKLHSR